MLQLSTSRFIINKKFLIKLFQLTHVPQYFLRVLFASKLICVAGVTSVINVLNNMLPTKIGWLPCEGV